MDWHNYCLGLQVVVLPQALLDDQIAVLALDREPLTNLVEAPVEVGRLLLVQHVQGTEMAVPVLSIGHDGVSLFGWRAAAVIAVSNTPGTIVLTGMPYWANCRAPSRPQSTRLALLAQQAARFIKSVSTPATDLILMIVPLLILFGHHPAV
jgi:hypothetical protein